MDAALSNEFTHCSNVYRCFFFSIICLFRRLFPPCLFSHIWSYLLWHYNKRSFQFEWWRPKFSWFAAFHIGIVFFFFGTWTQAQANPWDVKCLEMENNNLYVFFVCYLYSHYNLQTNNARRASIGNNDYKHCDNPIFKTICTFFSLLNEWSQFNVVYT